MGGGSRVEATGRQQNEEGWWLEKAVDWRYIEMQG